MESRGQVTGLEPTARSPEATVAPMWEGDCPPSPGSTAPWTSAHSCFLRGGK